MTEQAIVVIEVFVCFILKTMRNRIEEHVNKNSMEHERMFKPVLRELVENVDVLWFNRKIDLFISICLVVNNHNRCVSKNTTIALIFMLILVSLFT